MSAESKTRVLSIGVVQDGKLVQERALPAGESLSIGGANNATLVFPDTPFGNKAFPLFVHEGGSYTLRYTEDVRGKVTTEGKRVALDKAAKEGGAASVGGGVYSVPLVDGDKGKIRIGPVTILFKFVEPINVPTPVGVDKLDFRPRILEDDEDPVFFIFLGVWAALGVALSVYVNAVEAREITLEEIPDRFTRNVFVKDVPKDEPKVEVEEPPEDALKVGKAEEAKPEPKPSDTPRKEPQTTEEKVADAKQKEELKKGVAEESALFQELQARMIGTTGSNARGTVLLQNAEGGFDSNLSEKLAQAEAAGGSLGDGSRLRGSDGKVGGTGTARDIGGVEKGREDGTAQIGPGPKIEAPKGSVSAGDIDVGGGDVANVSKVVRKYQGQLKYCYEKSLKSNASLAGRVVVAWYIDAEKATDVQVIDNTTGDREFASCIEGKIRRWEFKDVDDGEAKSSFVFAPEG